jgi:hypothetical protein
MDCNGQKVRRQKGLKKLKNLEPGRRQGRAAKISNIFEPVAKV